MLSLIGDQYTEDAQHVNGCVVSVRSKGDRISLWTKDWRNADVTKRIGYEREKDNHWIQSLCFFFVNRNRFREVAEIPRNLPLIFEVRFAFDWVHLTRWLPFFFFYQSHEDQESKRGATSKILFRAWIRLKLSLVLFSWCLYLFIICFDLIQQKKTKDNSNNYECTSIESMGFILVFILAVCMRVCSFLLLFFLLHVRIFFSSTIWSD